MTCRALIAAAAAALIGGCTGAATSALTPRAVTAQGVTPALREHFPGPFWFDIVARTNLHFASFYACPFKGAIEYVSDASNNVIYVYNGKFAGQSPCGLIASASLSSPRGLFVNAATHDLYVANWGASNVLVFHKARTSPYNTYSDPTAQNPNDVTVTDAGIVITSNEEASDLIERGSISTWIGGLNGGTFVSNFPMTNDFFGLFVTLKQNGMLYFNDVDATSGIGALWKVSCPGGECGAQTQMAGISFGDPGGMVFNTSGKLLVNDSLASAVETFNLPNPHPTTKHLPCCPLGMALDNLHGHWFYTSFAYAAEYSYPGFALIGKVTGNNGAMFGIAVDP
ncbi:MAG TPA: hypothetical protein VII69_10915 [Candidatus Eremiobacteraceae bacterium]